ncbi:MAG: reprolysin-like metallopeptidase [Bacteroidota bacterium]
MKLVSTCFLFLFGSLVLLGQQMQFIGENQLDLPSNAEVNFPVADYQLMDVELANVYEQLKDAPQEFTRLLQKSKTTIQLPLPQGSWRSFKVIESSVLAPALQARWPQIRTYRILDAEDQRFQGRLTLTPQGITALYTSPFGEVLLEPFATGQFRYHAVYYNHDVVLSADDLPQFACGYQPGEADEVEVASPQAFRPRSQEKSSTVANINEFVMALTCTGEYAQQKGGTVESVLASFVQAINLANTTFEREVGVRIRLIENQESLIFLNAGTDPFINADEGGELLGQVRDAILGAGIPSVGYDMGHVFTSGCTDVGGVVGGQVCTTGKDRGVTCHYTNNIAAIIRRVFTHEVAHQFAVAHSWSNCPNSLGQLATGSAYEPGSGTTIMSYAGTCGAQNVAFDNDDYYHGHSLEQFMFFTREGQGSNCATVLDTDNSEPKLTLDYTNGFYIPISTPFELIAAAEDQDDDNLTYCWEQLDLGPLSDLGMPTGNAPLFRSFSPNADPNRVFPRLPILVNNSSENTEVLPTYSRDLTFRCTVRDNNPEIGATLWEDVAFRSTASAGPFLVMSPNTGGESWKVGEYREVTWDVANTNNEFVDCQLVNIRLSTDGGFTYPHTLLTETPNIGSAFVTVPEFTGNEMRIRVEAADNIFFDISNNDFRIEPAEEPTYTVSYGPVFQQICLPDVAEVTFSTGSVLDFEGLVSLEISSELPEGVVANFADTDLTPGESTSLSLDFTALENYDGPLEIQVATSSPDLDPVIRSLYFEIVDNDFSELELLTPAEGENDINIGTDFSWAALPNALTYDWELSDDAAFSNILDSSYGMTETSYTPSIQFAANTLFFWRVRATNECGTGDWLQPQVFHTVNAICSPQASEDTPITIPGTGPLPTVESEIFVPFEGVISDVNIPNVAVRYQPIQNFYISVISPSGTEVRLYDQSCFGTDQVRIGFDDDAPLEIFCPPDDQVLFQPVEPLAAFIGESSQGTWTMRVKVLETGFGAPGQLGDWSIEFCAQGNAVAPNLLDNDTLFVPPLESNPIGEDLLSISDAEQGPFQLTYTLVSTPQHGALFRIDEELQVGSNFTQGTINAGNLRYLNTNPDVIYDDFTFVVEDGTGGFLPVQQFNIKIDEDAVVNTEDLNAGPAFRLFPNPTQGWVQIQLGEPAASQLPLRLYRIDGQLLWQEQLPAGSLQYQMPTEVLPAGVYLVQLGGKTTRLIKQ